MWCETASSGGMQKANHEDSTSCAMVCKTCKACARAPKGNGATCGATEASDMPPRRRHPPRKLPTLCCNSKLIPNTPGWQSCTSVAVSTTMAKLTGGASSRPLPNSSTRRSAASCSLMASLPRRRTSARTSRSSEAHWPAPTASAKSAKTASVSSSAPTAATNRPSAPLGAPPKDRQGTSAAADGCTGSRSGSVGAGSGGGRASQAKAMAQHLRLPFAPMACSRAGLSP
mmetsp:Transcript_153761/g.493029  ORF Transcript_153761/g.493029 Transcript_153761/m.493029 type:complete len:229 (+) Transcript_153761:547-1233(+)